MKRLSLLFVLLLGAVAQAQQNPAINGATLQVSRSRIQLPGQPAVEWFNVAGHYRCFDQNGCYAVWSWSPTGTAGTWTDLGMKYLGVAAGAQTWVEFGIDALDHTHQMPATNDKVWFRLQLWNAGPNGGTSNPQVRHVKAPGT